MANTRDGAIAPIDTSTLLGAGWAFPLQINTQGSLQLSAAERSVEESIWLILRTDVGERVGEPEFGSTLTDFAFAPMNMDTLVQICIAVEDALVRWEPRIVLEDVRADPDPVRGRIDLVIQYRLIDHYEPRSLVYPFYLQPEGEVDTQLERSPYLTPGELTELPDRSTLTTLEAVAGYGI
ncbi:MAG: GPW/gp25 family protein [Leptolyngbyaceae bacterium]|nr:GPW/gp25 family protein [Leptolyngbyaceae bacterium]